MQLTQFLDSLKHILSYIERDKVLTEYSTILSIISQTDKESISASQLKKVKESLKKLDSFHKKIETENKNELFCSVMAIIDNQNTLGSKAISEIHKASTKIESDTIPLVECIWLLRDETKQLLVKIEENIKVLELLSVTSINDTLLPVVDASCLFNIEFHQQASIGTMADLEKNSRIWDSILQAFIKLTRSNVSDVSIHRISKDKIEISTNEKVISSITKGLTSILNSYNKTLDILKLQFEIYQLNLTRNNEIDTLLKEEMKDLLEINSSTVASELITEYEWNGDLLEEDIYKQIKVSLIQVFSFFEKGGRISTQQSGNLKELNKRINQAILDLEQLKNEVFPENTDTQISEQFKVNELSSLNCFNN